VGGSVTVVTVGDDESEEVLRREMAMGADNGLCSATTPLRGRRQRDCHPAQGGRGKGQLRPDPHRGPGRRRAGQVGGMLAAMLDVPYASLVNKIEVDGDKLKVGREIEGGNQEMNEIDLPCVLSIQTGINEPRYVGIRGIRKVASVEIPEMGAGDLGVTPPRGRRRRQGQTAGLLRAGTGRGRRDAGRQHRRDHRQTD
jgi:electron transfer flavoprotein beta subunit